MAYNPNNPNGQATSANSAPVVLASDQSTVPVSVSGVATAANQSTEITALNQIHSDLIAALPAGSNTIGNVNAKAQDGAGTAITSTLINSKQRLDVTLATGAVPGATSPNYVDVVGGTDGTNARQFLTDASGRLAVNVNGTVPVSQKNSTSVSATLQSAAVATGTGTVFNIDGYSSVILTVSGTFVGTILFEGTENGTIYSSLSALQLGTTNVGSTTTTTGLFEITVSGLVNIRANITAYTSGSITVTGHAVAVPYAPKVTQESRLPSALGQVAAASSLPVTLSNENVLDQFITGQSAQTATINNIIPATAGTNGTDCQQYRSGYIQIVSTGTGGTFIFEQSNDPVNNFQTMVVNNMANTSGGPIAAAITATASQIVYGFPITARYIRVRVVSTITGGSIQAVTILRMTPYAAPIVTVAQNTGSNLQMTPSSTPAMTGIIASAAAADGTANPTGVGERAFPHNFNGSTWDRPYNNYNTTTGDTGAKTANFNGAAQTNFNARGATITLILGTVTGTITTFQTWLSWSPDGGTTWIQYGAKGTNITTPASGNTITWQVYPTNWSTAGATPAALTTGATQTNQINGVLPRTWKFNADIAGTTPSITFTSVQVNYHV
jgi:hypothetical protein